MDAVLGSRPLVQMPRNRQSFYLIRFHAMCDLRCLFMDMFMDIFMGQPGSVQYVQGQDPPEGYCILEDSGYPLMPTSVALITPYREPERNMMVARFNIQTLK